MAEPTDEPQPKPYRVYKGGRTKGRVPLRGGAQRTPPRDGKVRPPGVLGPPGRAPTRRFRPNLRSARFWIRTIGTSFLLFALLVVGWGIASYFAVRDGAKAANVRLPRGVQAQLDEPDGMLLFHTRTILYLGIDHSRLPGRAGNRHSDTILLIRTDPGKHKLAYLSIPRDLRVEIPGQGFHKINAAYQIGGPALALRTIRRYTGLDVNHVLIADFNVFRIVIDELGGIDVTVPSRILSNEFDCPYSFERCQSWEGWRFAKGRQHMNGWRALIYSRIRENKLNPGESDLTRGERQQAVMQATFSKATSVGTFYRAPWIADDVLEPLTTDLAAGEVLQLGWVLKRADRGRTLHCRLGGTGSEIGGEAVIQPTEENFAVIHMFTGESAPQPPLPGSGPFGPGCVVGSGRLG
ncbi:MAG: LCP family protein [Gaiellaceae bacterium]